MNPIFRIFKLEKVSKPFDINIKYGPEVLIETNWLIDGDDFFQSEQLNNQIKANVLIQRQIENNCREGLKSSQLLDLSIITDYEKNRGHVFTEENLPALRSVCKEYMLSVRNEHDVISRDHDVFTSINKLSQYETNITYYAVVIYDTEGHYIGHVYLWISPYDSTFAFMIGIRASTLMPFIRLKNSGFKNVSGYLLTAVEKFVKENGANKLVIPYPIGKMKGIAIKNGFKLFKNINDKIIGKGGYLTKGMVDFYSQTCKNYYMKEL